MADAAGGAMRCLCDAAVNGRAVAICSGEENGGESGSANFDLCDEMASHSGGEALLEHTLRGKFWKI